MLPGGAGHSWVGWLVRWRRRAACGKQGHLQLAQVAVIRLQRFVLQALVGLAGQLCALLLGVPAATGAASRRGSECLQADPAGPAGREASKHALGVAQLDGLAAAAPPALVRWGIGRISLVAAAVGACLWRCPAQRCRSRCPFRVCIADGVLIVAVVLLLAGAAAGAASAAAGPAGGLAAPRLGAGEGRRAAAERRAGTGRQRRLLQASGLVDPVCCGIDLRVVRCLDHLSGLGAGALGPRKRL